MNVYLLSLRESKISAMHCVALNKIDPSYKVCEWPFVALYTPPLPRLFLTAWQEFREKGQFSLCFWIVVLLRKPNVCSKLAPLLTSHSIQSFWVHVVRHYDFPPNLNYKRVQALSELHRLVCQILVDSLLLTLYGEIRLPHPYYRQSLVPAGTPTMDSDMYVYTKKQPWQRWKKKDT